MGESAELYYLKSRLGALEKRLDGLLKERRDLALERLTAEAECLEEHHWEGHCPADKLAERLEQKDSLLSRVEGKLDLLVRLLLGEEVTPGVRTAVQTLEELKVELSKDLKEN